MLKVVYFDEGSATDLIYITQGGEVSKTIEQNKKHAFNFLSNFKARMKAMLNLLPFVGGGFEGKFEIETGYYKDNIMKRAVSNTILTDYLSMPKGNIYVFEDQYVYPYEMSIAHIKMIAPYLIMTEGKIRIGRNNEDFSLNISKLDEAIKSAKGYFELLASDGNHEFILRFNIDGFRNNYRIHDLVQMKLEYHAVKVGTFSKEDLAMKDDFFSHSKNKKTIDGGKIAEKCINKKNHTNKELPIFNENEAELSVYDVILAGVKDE